MLELKLLYAARRHFFPVIQALEWTQQVSIIGVCTDSKVPFAAGRICAKRTTRYGILRSEEVLILPIAGQTIRNPIRTFQENMSTQEMLRIQSDKSRYFQGPEAASAFHQENVCVLCLPGGQNGKALSKNVCSLTLFVINLELHDSSCCPRRLKDWQRRYCDDIRAGGYFGLIGLHSLLTCCHFVFCLG